MKASSSAVAGLTAVVVAALSSAGWIVVLAPTAASGLRPFLLVLVAIPTTIAVAVGAATVAHARLAPDTERPELVRADSQAAALSIITSALGFAVVATLGAIWLDVQELVALTIGLGLGAAVAVVLAVGTYAALASTERTIFAAGPLGSFGVALTVAAVGVVGTFVVGIIATAVLVRQHGAVPQVPLQSIPVGIVAGLLLATATALVLRRHVRRQSSEAQPP